MLRFSQGTLWTHAMNVKKHDDVIKWRYFPRYWPFVRGIHRSPVNSPHKGQWRGALMFSLICVWINGWVNNGKAGELRRHRPHHEVIVMDLFVIYVHDGTISVACIHTVWLVLLNRGPTLISGMQRTSADSSDNLFLVPAITTRPIEYECPAMNNRGRPAGLWRYLTEVIQTIITTTYP